MLDCCPSHQSKMYLQQCNCNQQLYNRPVHTLLLSPPPPPPGAGEDAVHCMTHNGWSLLLSHAAVLPLPMHTHLLQCAS
jgi:hypothetical protein